MSMSIIELINLINNNKMSNPNPEVGPLIPLESIHFK